MWGRVREHKENLCTFSIFLFTYNYSKTNGLEKKKKSVGIANQIQNLEQTHGLHFQAILILEIWGEAQEFALALRSTGKLFLLWHKIKF